MIKFRPQKLVIDFTTGILTVEFTKGGFVAASSMVAKFPPHGHTAHMALLPE